MYVCIVGGEVSNSTRWTPVVTLPRPKAAITRCNSFVLMLRYCSNLKAIRYESTNSNRIVADKLHRVIVA